MFESTGAQFHDEEAFTRGKTDGFVNEVKAVPSKERAYLYSKASRVYAKLH